MRASKNNEVLENDLNRVNHVYPSNKKTSVKDPSGADKWKAGPWIRRTSSAKVCATPSNLQIQQSHYQNCKGNCFFLQKE